MKYIANLFSQFNGAFLSNIFDFQQAKPDLVKGISRINIKYTIFLVHNIINFKLVSLPPQEQ